MLVLAGWRWQEDENLQAATASSLESEKRYSTP
jgi:hypothetical protein